MSNKVRWAVTLIFVTLCVTDPLLTYISFKSYPDFYIINNYPSFFTEIHLITKFCIDVFGLAVALLVVLPAIFIFLFYWFFKYLHLGWGRKWFRFCIYSLITARLALVCWNVYGLLRINHILNS